MQTFHTCKLLMQFYLCLYRRKLYSQIDSTDTPNQTHGTTNATELIPSRCVSAVRSYDKDNQCDQIMALFENSWQQILVQKQPKYLVIFGYLKTHHFLNQKLLWQLFCTICGKCGLLFYSNIWSHCKGCFLQGIGARSFKT